MFSNKRFKGIVTFNPVFTIFFILFSIIIYVILLECSQRLASLQVLAHSNSLTLKPVLFTGILIFLFFFLRMLFDIFLNRIFYNSVLKKLRQRLFKKFFSLPFMYYYTHNAGDVSDIIGRKAENAEAEKIKIYHVLSECLIVLFIIYQLWQMNPQLTIVSILLNVPFVLIYLHYFRKQRQLIQEGNELFSVLYRYLIDSLRGRFDIIANNAFSYFKNKFCKLADETTVGNIGKWQTYIDIQEVIYGNAQRIVPLLSIILFSLLAEGIESITKILPFYFLYLMLPNVKNLVLLKELILNAQESGKPLYDFINQEEEINGANIPDTLSFHLNQYSVILRNRVLLKDVTLNIEPGEKVLIIGDTGTGKSVLLNSLAGISYPFSGTIRIGSRLISDVDFKKIRQRTAYNDARGFIIKGSIIENLCFGSDASSNEALALIKDTKLDTYMPKFHNPFEIINSDSVSDGERASISFLRSLLKKPNVLFLDEVTASMTDNIEALLIRYVIEHVPTVIAISHKYSSLSFFKRVLFIKENKVFLDLSNWEAKQNSHIKSFYKQQISIQGEASKNV